MFFHPQVTHTQGQFKVDLSMYYELANDMTAKCIKLCVTTSPSGYPRCNLNSTTDTAAVDTIKSVGSKRFGFPHPEAHQFRFVDWEVRFYEN